MNVYERRDSVLNVIYSSGKKSTLTKDIAAQLGIEDEVLNDNLRWLDDMGLTKSMWYAGGIALHSRLTALGRNFVELNKSTRLLAEQTVNGAIMQQNNHNYGGQPINNMGDHVNITSNVTSGNIAEIVEALRVNGEEGRAVELESAEKSHGTQSAIQKVLEWVKEKWVNPAALTAVNGVLIAHGIAT